MPYAVLGTLILWFGWFGFNPGSTLGVVTGDKLGYFGYVALTTNLAAAAGALGGIGVAWLVLAQAGRLDDAERRASPRSSRSRPRRGFVAPWAAVVIGVVAGVDRGRRRPLRRADRHRRPDRRRRGARHGRRLGDARARALRRARARRRTWRRARRARLHGQLPPARRAGARPRRGRRVHVQRCRSAASGR